jgi:hypothetical protein
VCVHFRIVPAVVFVIMEGLDCRFACMFVLNANHKYAEVLPLHRLGECLLSAGQSVRRPGYVHGWPSLLFILMVLG